MGGNNFKRLALFLLLFLVLIFGPHVPVPSQTEDYQELLPGTVTNLESTQQEDVTGEITVHQILTVEVNSGNEDHETLIIDNSDNAGLDARLFAEGDKVYVSKMEIPESEPIYSIADHDRRTELYILFGLFCVIVVLISGKQGVESFLGMVFSFAVLIKLILPLLFLEVDPVLSA